MNIESKSSTLVKRPLALKFKEAPTAKNFDYSQLEYSDILNLSIDKTTGFPAIESVNMDTETTTKTQIEGSDSDNDRFRMVMDTETEQGSILKDLIPITTDLGLLWILKRRLYKMLKVQMLIMIVQIF